MVVVMAMRQHAESESTGKAGARQPILEFSKRQFFDASNLNF
jgi:hypothetical protein